MITTLQDRWSEKVKKRLRRKRTKGRMRLLGHGPEHLHPKAFTFTILFFIGMGRVYV